MLRNSDLQASLCGMERRVMKALPCSPKPYLLRGPGVVVVHKGAGALGPPAEQAGRLAVAVAQTVVLGVLDSLLGEQQRRSCWPPIGGRCVLPWQTYPVHSTGRARAGLCRV